MTTNVSVLFYIRNTIKTKNGLSPIYLRMTIEGARLNLSTHRSVNKLSWDNQVGRAKGNSESDRILNAYLETLRNKVFRSIYELERDNIEVTLDEIREKWDGKENKFHSILKSFEEHNSRMKELVGKEYAPLTYLRYETTLAHLKRFLQHKYKKNDFDVEKIDYQFISDLWHWFQTVRGCNYNSTMKYVVNFKKIILICLQKGWITRNPFQGFKMTKQEVIREFLSEEEMEKLAKCNFASERNQITRDVFLFACYTGLAYVDVKKLKRSEIRPGIDGELWLHTFRQKTKTPTKIPILPPAEAILQNYRNHPSCQVTGLALPVPSNQKLNDYLKELADKCEIPKELTFHIARHTFATSVTLNNGVPIETVSRMLGHKNLKTTQHYAKLLDHKVSHDMQLLSIRLFEKKRNSKINDELTKERKQ